MVSDKFIEIQTKQLKELGDRMNYEAQFAKQFVDSNKRPKNENNWFRSVRSITIYSSYQIKLILDTLDSFRDKSEEQIGYYIGKTAIQSFLDIINAYEHSTNKLVKSSIEFKSLLESRIDKKIKLIEEGWKSDVNRKSRDMKQSLIKSIERKVFEMKFIRDTLKKEGIIDSLDYKIMEFAWDIRNSMHSNFQAIKDIEFSAPGTSLNYSFHFKEGEELYHPKDLSSFYSITKQLIFIQLKILQHFNKLKEKNES